MVHSGTVHLNDRDYSLDLNRSSQAPNDSTVEPSGTVVRRNFPTTRSGIILLHPRKALIAQNSASVRAFEDLHRLARFRWTEQRQVLAPQPKWKIDREAAVNLVSRFLSWYFPVREFKSPLQRVLYLSIEGPKSKYRKRFSLP